MDPTEFSLTAIVGRHVAFSARGRTLRRRRMACSPRLTGVSDRSHPAALPSHEPARASGGLRTFALAPDTFTTYRNHIFHLQSA